jgi:uncharacterized protein YdaL
MKKWIVFVLALLAYNVAIFGAEENKNVLILVEGKYNITQLPTGQGRELAQLLGHFNVNVNIAGLDSYKTHDIEKYNFIFYVGFSSSYQLPDNFLNDVLRTRKQVIWINYGIAQLGNKSGFETLFGFRADKFDKNSVYDLVRSGSSEFQKGSPDINFIEIRDPKKVEVLATAFSSKTKKEIPYMVKTDNFTYVADLPFLGATENDRYLYFADKLHDILNEQHPESHLAIIRIEDVTPLNDPDKLRDIADLLSARGIPFLVGVVPIYVNPIDDRRVPLTDKPELVDALKYMVQNGGNIVMHGVTHQYKGISTDDFEFWDGSVQKPIKDEHADDIERKIDNGINEFVKNGLYPIAWETPHYAASNLTYEVVSKFFGTVVEQRMAIENFDYGQYFPYIIQKDLYGQTIFPENLGYVPLNPNIDSSRVYVRKILKGAQTVHQIRDGIASCFFHPFLNIDLLEELVDGIKSEGYTFLDLSNYTNHVRARNKIILTGSQTYTMNIDNSFLQEVYYDGSGNIIKKESSQKRILGEIKKNIRLDPGEMYVAEANDFHIIEPTVKDRIEHFVSNTYTNIVGVKEWEDMRVTLMWNHYAKGAAFNDQSSFATMFKSLNINVDTVFVGQDLDLESCNLLVLPFASVDSLTYFDISKIERFVRQGGNLITDRKNKLIEKFGIKFLNAEAKMHAIRDMYYPQEPIMWRNSQLPYKFDYTKDDEVFCEDINTGLATAIGRTYDRGKIIFFNTAFDPSSQGGYSYYPYIMEYIKKFFQLKPVFKRENLSMYFDPGLRQNTSVENLVKTWVRQGIRIIQVSGWHQYPKYNYDYKRLIKLAHANGILVYAWIEPPQVSQKFWQQHPEWREKNFKNEDITPPNPDWRYPVALTDKKCLEAVMNEYSKLLSSYDWDGVNLSELYFDAGRGFEDPNVFAPVHPSANNEFRIRFGYSIKDVLTPSSAYFWKVNPTSRENLIRYRILKVNELHNSFVKLLTDYAKTKEGFQVIVTFMDSHFSPEMKEYHGINSDDIVNLQNKYDIQLQAEDPQSKWSTDPVRYMAFGKYYAGRMKDSSRLLIDLNILSFRKKDEVTPFPTMVQTGVESYQLINYATRAAGNITVYSEATCNPQDLAFFPYASAGQVKYTRTSDGYKVNSPYSFILQLPRSIKIIEVDGQGIVGYRENSFMIAAGEHTINVHQSEIPGFSTAMLQPQILSFTGNILSETYSMRKIGFTYACPLRALASLNSKPTKMEVDGKDYDFKVLTGNDCYSVYLPPGNHNVEITTGDKFSYGLNITSLWSTNAIAIYGVLAVALLFIMFVALKVIRRTIEN